MSRSVALFVAVGVYLGSVGIALSAPAAPRGEAVAGKTLFKQCVLCHGAGGEGNALGPDIRAIVGRGAASQPDFAYSAALRRSRKVWTGAELTAFLLKPQAAVPGTRMAYAGAGSPENAAALTAYLATLR